MRTDKLIWRPLVNGRGYWAKGILQHKIYKMVTDDLKLRFECHTAMYHNDFDLYEIKKSLKQAKKHCSKFDKDIKTLIINIGKTQEVQNDN